MRTGKDLVNNNLIVTLFLLASVTGVLTWVYLLYRLIKYVIQ